MCVSNYEMCYVVCDDTDYSTYAVGVLLNAHIFCTYWLVDDDDDDDDADQEEEEEEEEEERSWAGTRYTFRSSR